MKITPGVATLLIIGALEKSVRADEMLVFADEFDLAGLIDESFWTTPTFRLECNPAFFGRTALRNWRADFGQDQLVIENGYAVLPLDTFNPFGPGESFLGTEIDTIIEYELLSGLGFEARVWIDPALPAGVVTSLFGLHLMGSCPNFIHDEIDFEFLSTLYLKPPVEVLTNVYDDDPFGPGAPQVVRLNETMLAGQWHVFRINWLADSIEWFVDGVLVDTRPPPVPDGPLGVRLNVWVPDDDFPLAWDAGFQPVATPQQNTRYEYRVDYVRIYRITPGCLEDLDGDGVVGISDLLTLLAAWGSGPPGPPDLDGDGSVGISDLLQLLGSWGPCS